MDVTAFRAANKEFLEKRPFSDPDESKRIRDKLHAAAAPEHVGKNVGNGMLDQFKCCCNWESPPYFDGSSFAWNNWREHVADEMGLNPKECPCGKTYISADGEKPCHELRSLPMHSRIMPP